MDFWEESSKKFKKLSRPLRSRRERARAIEYGIWRTCTFQGLGDKKQDYLDLLEENAAKKGYQRVEKIEPVTWGWAPLLSKISEIIFEFPKKGFWICIKCLSKGADLRVGFEDFNYNPKLESLMLAASMLLGALFCFLSILIIGHGTIPLPPTTPRVMLLIPVIIFFVAFIGAYLFFGTKTYLAWRNEAKQLLVETAESMGSKQITPFKKTTVELED